MSPAHVLEPTYRRLKRGLMDGTWTGGTKLEAQRLADELGISMTPVRDSLNQLVGEGLVDLTPGEGFRVASLTEQGLRELLGLNLLLLEAAAGEKCEVPGAYELAPGKDDYADRVASAFASLASRSHNRSLAALVDRIGERLHSVRRHEPDIIPDALGTLDQIESSVTASLGERRGSVRRYHRRCQESAAQLVGRWSGLG